MIIGKVTKIIKDRGFGFITDGDGKLYFFHYSALDPRGPVSFEEMNEDCSVEFDSEEALKGPRAKPRSLRVISNLRNGIKEVLLEKGKENAVS